MANRENITDLLREIKQLEELVSGVQNAEIYPVSFFSQTFDLTRKILTDLHTLEANQIEALKKQMEEHQALIQAIPVSRPVPQPEPEKPVAQPVPAPPMAQIVAMPEPEVITEREKVIKEELLKEVVSTIQPEPEVLPQPERPEEVSIPETSEPEIQSLPPLSEKTSVSLHEVLAKKNLSDFRKAFSLNDRFYFRRELFGNDEEKMNKTISVLNDIHSLDESVEYIQTRLGWDPENPCVSDFVKLLEKRFL